MCWWFLWVILFCVNLLWCRLLALVLFAWFGGCFCEVTCGCGLVAFILVCWMLVWVAGWWVLLISPGYLSFVGLL